MSPIGTLAEVTKLRPLVLGAISAALILGLASAAWSQDSTGSAAGGSGSGGFGLDNDNKDPIEISADNGIEWKRDVRTYTARGNALAQQGNTSIAADTLIAYLDEQDEIAHWEAIGNVKIRTSQSTSYGDHADYQESTRLLVLTGQNLKVVTESQTVTARDQIEYWRDKDAVVAKGNVVIVRPQKNTIIKSDEATAYFRDKTDDPATPADETGDGSEVYQVEAQGHVRVDRKEQTAFSDHLAYNPDTEVAVLTGNVVIHSKDNTYKGARAELDLQKDISRLIPAPGKRVFTTINPKNDDDDTNSGTQPAPVTQ
jgi:lipopolysaccharide export system protein LptA